MSTSAATSASAFAAPAAASASSASAATSTASPDRPHVRLSLLITRSRLGHDHHAPPAAPLHSHVRLHAPPHQQRSGGGSGSGSHSHDVEVLLVERAAAAPLPAPSSSNPFPFTYDFPPRVLSFPWTDYRWLDSFFAGAERVLKDLGMKVTEEKREGGEAFQWVTVTNSVEKMKKEKTEGEKKIEEDIDVHIVDVILQSVLPFHEDQLPAHQLGAAANATRWKFSWHSWASLRSSTNHGLSSSLLQLLHNAHFLPALSSAESLRHFPLSASGTHQCSVLQSHPPLSSSAPSPASKQRNLAGVGFLVVRRSGASDALEILLGKRKGSHGAGLFSAPGGHLEFGEDFFVCGARECEEETALRIDPKLCHFVYLTNNAHPTAGKQYITLVVQWEMKETTQQKVQNVEPNKCEEWRWVPWKDLTSGAFQGELFGPIKSLVDEKFELKSIDHE